MPSEEKEKRRASKPTIQETFLYLESLFFTFFLACDLTGRTFVFSSTVWKFSVIVLALLYVLVELFRKGKGDVLFRRRLFLFFAMAMTLVSDLFLLVRNDNYIFGVCTFIVAQIFHALEIERSKKQAILSFSLRVAIPLAAILVLFLCRAADPLYLAVACYAPQLIGNFLEHFLGIFQAKDREEKRRSLLLAIAFALFLGCDICVGLSNLGFAAVSIWIWAFYAPSQALIAISCGRFCQNETESD